MSATELLLFAEELLATDDEDFAELDDATELLLFSLELLATDEEDFAELELATELLLFAEELLDPSLSLRMTLEEELATSPTAPPDTFYTF